MALPNGYNIKEYLPKKEDFEAVFTAKQNGNYFKLPYYPLGKDEPYYYPTVRIYLAAILLKWEELGKLVEQNLLKEKYSWSNGSKQLVPYYTATDLTIIRNFAATYKQVYLNDYLAYREAGQGLESPEKIVKKARDARKGQIETKIKGNGNLLRLICYSMKSGNIDPTKKQAGIKMHLFYGKKLGDKYSIVIRGSNLYGSGKNTITDAPYFKTEQEARNFIANIDHNHIDTKVTIEDWRFVISDKPLDNGYETTSTGNYVKRVYEPKISDANLVQTTCGPAYMLKNCKYFKESLETKSMNEAIEKHNTLNQKLFDGEKLKQEVIDKIEEVTNEFLKILAEDEVKIEVRDVIFTGSNASYNYTDKSDIDVHILAKTVNLNDPDKLYEKIYNAYRRLFEIKFDISFYGIPVEIYVETEDNPVISNGIYSVMFNQWIKYPEKDYVPEIDQKQIDIEAKPWIDRAKNLIKQVDDNVADGEELIDQFLADIYEMRQKGIYETEGGEFSSENLIFKEVRNAGWLDKLKELKNKVISKKLSLDEGIKYLDDDHEFKDYGTAEVNGQNVIDTHKASTFSTQDLLDGSIDAMYDGVIYTIIDLTPLQYFELCSKIQGMKPEEIIDFIGADQRQISHIKDVILKFNKRLPLPYVSFSSVDEVSGQEGRHRMYALGEMYGWDKEFPVMVIQDASTKKTVGELLNESIIESFHLDEKDRRDYIIKISQLTHYQPIIQVNGLFELYNVKEADADFILTILRRQTWIEYISKSAERYDFSKISYQGIPSRYFKITGKIRV